VTDKQRLQRLILDVLEGSSAFCMDKADEREALSDALTVDITGRFELEPRPKHEASSVLARVL
jgi:hypothetical protein